MIVRYAFVWLLLAVVAIGNGVLREATYGKRLEGLSAHQVSTLLGVLLTGSIVWVVTRFWPIATATQAWAIGVLWVILTVLFEFAFGHYVAGHSWESLLSDYNLLKGRLWLLFLLWLLVMPYLFYRLNSGKV
jgi:hypothetical protein